MSWATVTSPAGRIAARRTVGLAEPREHSRAAIAVIGVVTLLGLALRTYQLARPHLLLGSTGYDDGVDFGSALWLVHGALPYRDYVFVQPPGITLLMSPVALLSNAIGSDSAFAVARVLTACAGAASVALAGLLVRHRGALTTAVVCGILAIHPHAVFASRTVLLEPWLVLFCLAGALTMFKRDGLTGDRRRLVLGGVLFGFAGLIKVWAVLPVVVLVAVCWHSKGRRAARSYVGGVAAGFVAPLLPFLLAAPRPLVHDVIVVQLTRSDLVRVPAHLRLTSMFGLSDLDLSRTAIMLIGAGVFIIVVGLVALTRPRLRSLDAFVLASLALVSCALLWPTAYYVHYGAFFVPFFALSVGLGADRLKQLPPIAGRGVAVAVLGGLAAMAMVRVQAESRMTAGDPGRAIAAETSRGSCVVTDDPAFTIVSGRFTSGNPDCPKILDPVGLDYSISGGLNALGPGAGNAAIQRAWLGAFDRADFVWLSCFPRRTPACNLNTNRRIPLTGPVGSYLAVHFRRVPGVPAYLFKRVA